MDRRDFLKGAGAGIIGLSFTATLMKEAWGGLMKEQDRLYQEEAKAQPNPDHMNMQRTPFVRTLYALKAKPLDDKDPTPVGYIHQFFDSEQSRELLVRAGYLVCDGSAYDPNVYPELNKVMGSTYGQDSVLMRPKLPDLVYRPPSPEVLAARQKAAEEGYRRNYGDSYGSGPEVFPPRSEG